MLLGVVTEWIIGKVWAGPDCPYPRNLYHFFSMTRLPVPFNGMPISLPESSFPLTGGRKTRAPGATI